MSLLNTAVNNISSVVIACHMGKLMEMVEDESVSLIWTDPPFGTGRKQSLHSTWTGTGELSYEDVGKPGVIDHIQVLAENANRVLKEDGVMAILLDYRSIHHAVVEVEKSGLIYAGDIIWHFEQGGIAKKWWTNKHNTIALFHKGNPKFNLDHVPLTERKSPVGRGKYSGSKRKVNSVWSVTLGQTNKERVGYPSQKPLAIIEPFVLVHTDPGDLCIDPFCGSGGLAVAAKKNGRKFIVGDINPDAVEVTRNRLSGISYGRYE